VLSDELNAHVITCAWMELPDICVFSAITAGELIDGVAHKAALVEEHSSYHASSAS
jgi:hypothetical protein